MTDVSEYDAIEIGGFSANSIQTWFTSQTKQSTVIPVVANGKGFISLTSEGDDGDIEVAFDSSENMTITRYRNGAVYTGTDRYRIAFVKGIKFGGGGPTITHDAIVARVAGGNSFPTDTVKWPSGTDGCYRVHRFLLPELM